MPEGTGAAVQLLDADPDLARELDPPRAREAAQRLPVRVIDVPPVAGAALLGLDHVHAPAAAASRLRAAYGPDLRVRAAYGDTSGDTEMLAISEEPYFKVFTGRP